MRAVVLYEPTESENLSVIDVIKPVVKPGWVLVKIKAFGINRSELFTRKGQSPSVKFPRILGIECAGIIEDPSDSHFKKNQKVVSLMGGLGREFDGSYAEYALIPATQVYAVETDLDWINLAAIPEMFYTAYSSLFSVLNLKKGESLLIRGGTSSVGLAALRLAKSIGAYVISTTRNEHKMDLLKEAGSDVVLIDDDQLSKKINELFPKKMDKVLELVGTKTLKSSLQFVKFNGILCMSGILGNEWTLSNFEPMVDIPSGVYLSQFDSQNVNAEELQLLFNHIKVHHISIPVSFVFSLEEIGKAHTLMESNEANGKIVILVEA